MCFYFVVIYWQSVLPESWQFLSWISEICANIVGEQMGKLYPYGRSQYQFQVEYLPFLLLLAAALPLFSPPLLPPARALVSACSPGGPEALWPAWRRGMTISWCLATACSTPNPGLSPLFMNTFHCPLGLHLQNTSWKKIFLVVSSWWQQSVKPSLGTCRYCRSVQLQRSYLAVFPGGSSNSWCT